MSATPLAPLASLDAIRALVRTLPGPDTAARAAAEAREPTLTKPAGSLGRLEEIAAWLATWQGRHPPRLERVRCVIFAGNHGIAAKGVSAFPPEVTVQMVQNFRNDGAAVNQLCKAGGAELDVIELELDRPTQPFDTDAAMTEAEVLDALNAGLTLDLTDVDALIVGEMGIGNTTAAAALALALFGGTAEDWVGRGTGIDDAGFARKRAAVDAAKAFHGAALADPLEALRRVGGRELAAMAGGVLAARLARVPVLLDGFICSASAAVWQAMTPDGLDHAMAAHASVEPGHRRLLETLGKRPLLDLGMRLGEGSGALVALGPLRSALACHTGMATFAEAGVSASEAS
ncbi:nicotinate-nucleotide--dimethylbenzimidazole phosphoribosyltransferase [Roseospira marina]|uniref:Nicotinate-nucleotide--dimethylbenzimidazole phosphoribosyltransferase n=1 Tax=Roseospira marina TaxID=140057 RepID=A0A5M6IDS6_9PROT|nr:nicotinate-nucleotide--dimethylbenzimidazole phosphoribosyltransferase [Roseospira marina]KAA5605748.1 nicotinate-nucleotide--dimethylbenzimidazole phosphoribosyltransferase [Roseospira marina]MBB4313551.1 nicotinate-nucleotide--dimethylbenzimidazole phosphoribosyltransferase [Roseospira marina]MBB5086713.1 nicotinate-nucleotide--dimethylbenzimidazole phosphoribosyltransferase [Roseospira marina]